MKLPTNESELKEFQSSVDNMVNSFEVYKEHVNRLDKVTAELEKKANDLQITNDSLYQIIKNIYITLNANNESFSGNVQIEELVRELSKFVISREAIIAGLKN